jgi:hypothetical protein
MGRPPRRGARRKPGLYANIRSCKRRGQRVPSSGERSRATTSWRLRLLTELATAVSALEAPMIASVGQIGDVFDLFRGRSARRCCALWLH